MDPITSGLLDIKYFVPEVQRLLLNSTHGLRHRVNNKGIIVGNEIRFPLIDIDGEAQKINDGAPTVPEDLYAETALAQIILYEAAVKLNRTVINATNSAPSLRAQAAAAVVHRMENRFSHVILDALAQYDDTDMEIGDDMSKEIVNEIGVRNELKRHFGASYENVVDQIGAAIADAEAQGAHFADTPEELWTYKYAMANAIAYQTLAMADLLHLPTQSVLDLAKVEFKDGQLFLRGADFLNLDAVNKAEARTRRELSDTQKAIVETKKRIAGHNERAAQARAIAAEARADAAKAKAAAAELRRAQAEEKAALKEQQALAKQQREETRQTRALAAMDEVKPRIGKVQKARSLANWIRNNGYLTPGAAEEIGLDPSSANQDKRGFQRLIRKNGNITRGDAIVEQLKEMGLIARTTGSSYEETTSIYDQVRRLVEDVDALETLSSVNAKASGMNWQAAEQLAELDAMSPEEYESARELYRQEQNQRDEYQDTSDLSEEDLDAIDNIFQERAWLLTAYTEDSSAGGAGRAEPATFPAGQTSSTDRTSSTIAQRPVNVNSQYSQSKQGAFAPRRAAIRLTGAANRSTLGHELAHFWIDTQFSIWRNGQGTAPFNEQFGKIAGWLGITPDQRVLSRDQHEKFARGWEAYMSGRARGTSPDIKSAFRNFDKFLRRIYPNSKAIFGASRIDDARFTKEAFEFYDRFNIQTPAEYERLMGNMTEYAVAPSAPDKPASQEIQTERSEVIDAERQETQENLEAARAPAMDTPETAENTAAQQPLTPARHPTAKSGIRAYADQAGKMIRNIWGKLVPSATHANQQAMADQFVRSRPAFAKQIVLGTATNDTGIGEAYIYKALRRTGERLTANEHAQLVNSMRQLTSEAATILESTKGLTNDSLYIGRRVANAQRMQDTARKMFNNSEDAVQKYELWIKGELAKIETRKGLEAFVRDLNEVMRAIFYALHLCYDFSISYSLEFQYTFGRLLYFSYFIICNLEFQLQPYGGANTGH
ncbi:MAG: hypothetical protein LBH41_00660 [Rickettsiales bacterium]|jgi:hypothetical protein|nr:hypothetical protein [Rickettsiales bacterium]